VKRKLLGVALAALWLAPWRPARAQAASELLAQGISAYQQLNFEAATQLLTRALGPGLQGPLSQTQRVTGLTYLAASQLFASHQQAAGATLREVLLIDPRYEPDSLLFPPPVRSAFSQVRDSVKVVSVRLAALFTLLVGRDTLNAMLYASSLHNIAATLGRSDGTLVRRLYQGPILDSLMLGWDGRDAQGIPVAPGSYRLIVVSQGPGGVAARSVSVPLDITASHADTLTYPTQPPDSLFLPERTSAAPGLAALGIGALGAALTALLPQVVGAGSAGSGRRFIVSGAVGLAGLVGLVHRGLGRPIPGNVTANAVRRDAWRRQVEEVQRANRLSRAGSELHIQAGPPVRTEGPSR
jgi:hypothetical protein